MALFKFFVSTNVVVKSTGVQLLLPFSLFEMLFIRLLIDVTKKNVNESLNPPMRTNS